MSKPANGTTQLSPALQALQQICGPQRTLTRWLDRSAYASDASLYHLMPLAVVQPTAEADIQALFAWSQTWQIPLTFRAGGTSLSGQAITDGVLVDLARHWGAIEVLDAGQHVQVQPGVIGGQLNALLRQYGRKIGPDPASLQACMLGGILANNASGMCCGVSQNAYHTLANLRVILPNGAIIDSATADAQVHFETEHPVLHQGLLNLRAEVLANAPLLASIRRKYRQKNTTGYSLNALVDFDQTLQMLTHLMIGSEGTLGFIAAATLKTLPVLPHSATGLLFFASLEAACEAVSALSNSGAAAIELMDATALACVPQLISSSAPRLPPEAAALLVEYQAAELGELTRQLQLAENLCLQLPLCQPGHFSQDPHQQARLWQIRKGLYPSVGAVRQRGSSVVIEDVVFPAAQLARGARMLQRLFQQHGYPESIIFGHARDANLHFVMTPRFDTAQDIARYQGFLEELVHEVLALGGALKAEHGTGRNMAPFVEAEWGPEALGLMQRLKALLDPAHLLNPGVILNPNPQAHVAHLKRLPQIDPEVDACTECGFCEPACPSRRLSLTPRQRIVLRREQARLAQQGQTEQWDELQADYAYSGLATCATDSLCALACPIGLDTGALVKRLRAESSAPPLQAPAAAVPEVLQQAIGWGLSQGFGLITQGLRLGLQLWPPLQRLGAGPALQAVQQRFGGQAWPENWLAALPPPGPHALPTSARAGAAFVYFPSCLSRNLGYTNADTLPETLMHLARKAAVPVWLPPGTRKLCCGLPLQSKGLPVAARHQTRQTLRQLWHWSRQGALPVIMDTSPCTLHLQQALKTDFARDFAQLQILDSISWLAESVAPRLPLQQRSAPIVLHPVCSLRKMELQPQLESLAQRCSSQVITPLQAGCCGFAGDRGLLYPELPQAALGPLAQELQQVPAESRYASCSRSCEMGLSLVLGKPYRAMAHLLRESLP